MAEGNESNQNPQGSPGTPPAGTDGNAAGSQNPPAASPPAQNPDIQKLIQASEDRLRTHYSKELTKRDQLIEELRTKTMSESEVRKHKEQLLSDREQALARKELELYSVDVVKENGISLDLREFVMGTTKEETAARGKSLAEALQKAVEAAVQERFKQNGREPHKSETPAGKRSYTRAEVDALSKQVMLPTTSQKERESIMAELQAAAREGRIK